MVETSSEAATVVLDKSRGVQGHNTPLTGAPSADSPPRAIRRSAGRAARLLIPVLVATAAYGWLLWPALVGHRILAPTDLLLSTRVIGQESSAPLNEPANDLLFDPVFVFIPWLTFAAREIQSGNLPLWNPYIFCGAPFLANNQSGLFSPWNWVFFLWPQPATLAWIQLLKAAVATAGAALALERLGVRRWPALLMAAVYPFSGFMVSWMQYPLSNTAVWLPWVFYGTLSCLRRPGFRTSCLAAGAVAVLCLSGHLETAAQVLFGTAIFAMCAATKLAHDRGIAKSLYGLFAAALGGAFGLALAAPQILPTADYVRNCRRVELRKQEQIETILKEPDQWMELFRLFQPYVFGSRQAGSIELRTVCVNEGGANGYVGATTVFIGLLALLFRANYAVSLAVTAVLCAAPALRIPFLVLIENVPPLNAMNNARLLLLTGWCLLCLAALSVDRLGAHRLRFRHVLPAYGGLLMGLGVLGTMVLLMPPARLLHAYTVERWPWFVEHLLPTPIALAALGTLLFARAFWPGKPGLLLALAVVPLGETLAWSRDYNPLVPPATFYPETELIRALKERVEPHSRVLGLAGAMAPNVGMMYGFRDIRGYDAADPEPYVTCLLRANPKAKPRPYAALAKYWLGPGAVANMLAVRWVVTDHPLDVPDWYRVGRYSGLFLYENLAALPRAYIPRHARLVTPGADEIDVILDPSFDPREVAWVSGTDRVPPGPYAGKVEIVADGTDEVELRVTAKSDVLVVLADAWAPGWTVEVDGRPAMPLRVDAILRGVIVPTGTHRVRWVYRPWSFCAGVYIAGVAILTLCGCAIWSVVRGRKQATNASGRSARPTGKASAPANERSAAVETEALGHGLASRPMPSIPGSPGPAPAPTVAART